MRSSSFPPLGGFSLGSLARVLALLTDDFSVLQFSTSSCASWLLLSLRSFNKAGNGKKDGHTNAAQSKTTKINDLRDKSSHEAPEEVENWRTEKSSVKRAKTLARLPREKPPIGGKELLLITTPPKKGLEVEMGDNPYSALVALGHEGVECHMLDTQEEENMEEDEVEEYVPLPQ